jgi:hypothetical protein
MVARTRHAIDEQTCTSLIPNRILNDISTMGAHDAIPHHPEFALSPKPGAPRTSRRRFGRLPQESLQCNLGLVIDISAGGMRVLTRSKPRNNIHITLHGYPLPGPLVANVTWVKRAGLFMREIGLCFEGVTPEMAQVLTGIASIHRFRRVI